MPEEISQQNNQQTPPPSPSSVSLAPSPRFLAMSLYIPFIAPVTGLYVFLMKTTDSFLVHHMKQGVTLFFLWFFSVFLLVLFPFVQWFLGPILIALCALGMYAAYDNRQYNIPFVSKLATMLPFEKLYLKITGRPFPASQSGSANPKTSEPPKSPDVSTPSASPR